MAKLLQSKTLPDILKALRASRSGTALKTLCFLVLNLLITFTAVGQVTIPSGNTANDPNDETISRQPYGSYFGYQRSAMIYTAAEIGTSGNITAIGFYVESLNNPAASTPVVIYMKQTAASSFSSPTTVANEEAGATQVFSGNITSGQLSPNNWVVVQLNNPFPYSTTSNLEIIVETNTGGNGAEFPNADAKQFRFHSTGANTFQYWESDLTPPTFPGILSTYRPNVQLYFGAAPVCDAPTNLQVSNITDNSASLNFTASAGANSYTVTTVLATTNTTVGTTTGSGTSWSVSGLSASTNYEFVVVANCTGASSTEVRAAFQTAAAPVVCDAPTSVSGTGTGQTTAQVTFSGGTASSSYIIEYGPSSTFPSGTTTTTASGSPANLSGLTAGTTYTFVVRTDCGGGNISGNSPQGTFTTTCPSPTNLVVSNITQTGASLNFTASAGANSYTVTTVLASTNTTVGTTTGSGTSWSVSGLSASTNYEFVVVANCSGTTSSEVRAAFQTAAAPVVCNAPTSVGVNSTTATTAQVTFSGGTATSSYIIEYWPTGNTGAAQTTTATGSPANISGLTPGTAYTFVVRTDCGGGNISGNSPQGTFTTVCPTPTNLQVSNITQTSASLNFTASAGANSYTVTTVLASTNTTVGTTTGSGTSWSVSGLSASTNYEFVVVANCSGTTSSEVRAAFQTAAAPVVCNAPTSVGVNSTTATTAQVTFSGGTATSSYIIEYWPTGNTGAAQTTTATGSPANISGLTPGTAYTFVVRTDCGGGNISGNSPQGTFTTVCPTPTNLVVSNVTHNSATLNFTASSGASNYTVTVVPAGGNTPTGTVTGSGTTYNVSGLNPSTNYEFVVVANCTANSSTEVRAPFTTTAAPVLTCAAPTSVSGTATSPTTADITFSGGDYVSGNAFVIEYGPAPFNPGAAGNSTTGSSTTQPGTLTGLTPGTSYGFVVRITCTNGVTSGNSTTGSFTTPCPAPTNLVVSNVTNSGATLNFTASSGATNYTVTTVLASTNTTVGTTTGSGTTYNVSGLNPSTNYEFVVVANCTANSSTEVRAPFTTTAAPVVCDAPTSVGVTSTTNTTATITFSGGTATSSYIIEYWPTGNIGAAQTTTVPGSPAIISPLTQNTAYTFVVRTDCGGGNISGNSPQGTFTTQNVQACVPGTWEGTVSTDWHTAANWCNGIVPTSSTDVLIPAGTPFMPEISAAAATNNLTISAGATLTLAGGLLTVNGIYLNSGTLIDNGDGSLAFTGSTPQVVGKPGSTITFLDLTAGPGGILLGGPVNVRRVLTLNGDLTTNGNLFILEADPSVQPMVVNNSGVVMGEATFERYINPGINSGLGYRHLSSPVQNATINQLNDDVTLVVNPAYNTNPTPGTTRPFPTIYRYNESRLTLAGNSTFTFGWESPNSLGDAMPPGIGFTVNMPPVEVDIEGTLNNGTIAVGPLSRGNTTNSGWHLLGNPYPSPIDWDLVTVPAGMESAVYVFRSTGQYAGQYVSYTNGVGSPGTELIPAMQGFFVRVLSGSPTFTFNNSNRVTTYQNPALYRQSQAETRPLVELSLQNTITQIKDKLFVYFENGATAGADAQFDAHKIYNMVNVPSFYSVAGSDELSINGLPVSIPGTVVPLGASVPQPGTYTIDAEQILNFNLNQPIYLEDLQAGITVNLRQQPTYTFTTSQYSISGRFVLRFGPAGVTGTAEAAQLTKVAVYPNPNQGVFTLSLPAQSLANVEATLYNAIGQRVWSKTFRTNGASMQETINLEKLAKGVYSLRLETASGPVLKKIVIE